MSSATQTTSSSPEPEIRRRMVEAARNEFLRDGFKGASVDRIAAAAGVAKQTLYNHFPSKEALFGETIRAGTRDIVVELDDTPGELRERLLAFGTAFRAKLLSPEGLDWYRTMIADLSRFPDLGRIVWREGPAETLRRLAAFLESAMRRGELRTDNPQFAAEVLNSLLLSLDRTRGLLTGDVGRYLDRATIEPLIDCFLRAYRPDRGTP